MNDYKVILVDDEDDVRGRIISKIKPDSGFTVVGKAGNGFDALELIEELRPDVVITDIRMPFIDGIELARIIKRDYPTTKIAFISGYDEFDYARKAIELNVVSYLMKPISSSDIDAFLLRLKTTLDQEQQALRDTTNFQHKYNESIPLILDSYLSTFVLKSECSNQDIAKIESLGFDLSSGQFITGIVSTFSHNAPNHDDVSLFIRNMIDRVFQTYKYVFHFPIRNGVSFIVIDEHFQKSREIDNRLFELKNYVDEYYHIDLRIGISKVHQNFTSVPVSYRQAEISLEHSKFYNLGDMIYFDEVELIETKHVIIDDNLISDFEYAVKFWNEEEVNQILKRIKTQTMNDSKDYVMNYNYLVVSFMNSLMKIADSTNVDIGTVESDLLQTLLSFTDFDELLDYIKKIAKEIKIRNVEVQVNRAEEYVNKAKNYLNKHYSNPNVSLELVADHLNISVSYLSMLFKKIEQITFNKYLIKVRMEKAKEELRFTNEKVINIAAKCGYNEVYYFSHSFKRYTGLSPKEYRNND